VGHGAARNIAGNGTVVVQIANTGSNDTLTITSVGSNCGRNFHLGSIALGGNYVSANLHACRFVG
jgi:hypothetical protein